MPPARQSINIAASAAANLVSAIVGLMTIPYLVRQLGTETYGVWTLVVVTAGYFTLIDFGVNNATGRLIAARRGANDEEAVKGIISVAFTLFLLIAAACVLLALLVSTRPDILFNIPPHLLDETRASILISGIGVAIYFIFATFNGILWAFERFDLSSGIEAVAQIGRAAAIFAFITPDSSVLDLSIIALGGHLLSGVLLYASCRILAPQFRIELGRFSVAQARTLLHDGSKLFVLSALRNLVGLLSLTAIGNQLSLRDVAAYSIVRQLLNYAHAFLFAVTQTAASRAVLFYASEQNDRQTQLFSYGAVFATGCAFFIAGGFISLGQPFMLLWQGGRLDDVYPLLVILTLGELLPMSQWVTNGVLLGMQHRRSLIRLSLLEAIIAPLCVLLLGDHVGLTGICIALGVNATIFRGLLLWRLGMNVLELSFLRYVAGIILPIATITVTIVAVFLRWLPADQVTTWPIFLVAACAYGAAFASLFLIAFRLKLIRSRI